MVRALFTLALMALASPAQPQFEVASMKLVPPTQPGRTSFRSDPGRLDFRKAALAQLLQRAWSVPWYQIDWRNVVDSGGRKFDGRQPLYDVVATMPAGTSTDQQNLMLQSLLAERLKLQVHRGARDVPVYTLVIAKGGLRIHKSQNPPDADAPFHSADMSYHEWRYQDKMPIFRLIEFLRFEVDRPMIDLTGLEGFYDIDLRWPREETPLSAQGVPDIGNMTSLFSAMEKQLGLRVEPRKLSLEMLVIDRFDRIPTEN